mmetsp:Transcript_27319/g.78485  ORF Transcript_27319/g.78485 Transcript_27319/m.78485 type:complete len:218 (-) Transcript_27319:107-760(-)
MIFQMLTPLQDDEVVGPALDVPVLQLPELLAVCRHAQAGIAAALLVAVGVLLLVVLPVLACRDHQHDNCRRVSVPAQSIGALQGLVIHLQANLHEQDAAGARRRNVRPPEVEAVLGAALHSNEVQVAKRSTATACLHHDDAQLLGHLLQALQALDHFLLPIGCVIRDESRQAVDRPRRDGRSAAPGRGRRARGRGPSVGGGLSVGVNKLRAPRLIIR